MQSNHMSFGIGIRRAAIVATLMAERPYQDKPSGWPVHFFLDKLDTHGLAFTHQLLGNITLGLLAINHPDVFKRYVFEPSAPTRYVTDDKVEQLIPEAERELMLEYHIAVGISDSGISLVFACHDSDHQTVTRGSLAPLRTLEAYSPDGAATFIGTTVLDTLRALHPDVFVPFPKLIAPTEE